MQRRQRTRQQKGWDRWEAYPSLGTAEFNAILAYREHKNGTKKHGKISSSNLGKRIHLESAGGVRRHGGGAIDEKG